MKEIKVWIARDEGEEKNTHIYFKKEPLADADGDFWNDNRDIIEIPKRYKHFGLKPGGIKEGTLIIK